MKLVSVVTVTVLAFAAAAYAQTATRPMQGESIYATWQNGPPEDPRYFPIGVWLQAPSNAPKYRELGINLYIGLWNGPTEEHLAQLRAAGMQVICAQNDVGLEHINDKIIIGWMHGDEPDNAQSMENVWKNDLAAIRKEWPDAPDLTLEQYSTTYGQYGPPIPPAWTQRDYGSIRRRDPTRPVYLNLGQGVAYDQLGGRGTRSRHPEDYFEYCKGCDIVSYDVYPERKGGAERGKLWLVPKGVKRLHKYSDGQRIVWNIIEGSRSEATGNKPTAESLRVEAWMSIIHGSRGIIYFVHLFRPSFVEAGVLGDAELMAGMKSLHREINSLAPVINSPTVAGGASVTSSVPASAELTAEGLQPIAVMVKKHQGATYVFSVRMEGSPAKATFQVKGLTARATAQVLGEGRSIAVNNGAFADNFKGYGVHLYKITAP